jgi:biopolymer transport protein ExbD
MARPKIARKSTNIDMTAMCDVAFLLLSFFILATEFKPQEAVKVTTPNSVSAEVAPQKDVVMISITPEGKVFMMMDDVDRKKSVLEELNERKKLGWAPGDIDRIAALPFFGASATQLKSSLQMPAEQYTGAALPGIPAKDTANNEMKDWMYAVANAYQNSKINLLLKGDMNSKYPAFKNVIDAFKSNDLLKFKMVTNPENVPTDSELFRTGKRKTS